MFRNFSLKIKACLGENARPRMQRLEAVEQFRSIYLQK